ncbi:MAG TPA: SRPBCC family protein [Opitutaceae bacterium]|jgi:hypothetical protein
MAHTWNFYRTGGLDQASLKTAADLAALDELDPKLWVALSCPVKGLELDEKTLAMIDTDHDERIRVPEVIAAAKWLLSCLKNQEEALSGSDKLPLASINVSTPEGKAVADAARQVLANLGTPQADSITLDNFADPATLFPPEHINGDGVISAEATTDDEVKALIADVAACFGTVKGKTGSVGVTPEQVEKFFTDLEAYLTWAEASAGIEIRPFGDDTDAAHKAYVAVRAKISDYFTRCRLIAFDPRTSQAINRPPEAYDPIAPQVLAADSAGLVALPLSLADADKPLDLNQGVNPAWADAVEQFRTASLTPQFGAHKATLAEDEWIKLQGKFAAYEAWLLKRPGGKVAALDLPRARDIMGGKGKAGLLSLLARDAELGPGFEALVDLERLIRYRRDLGTLVHNFVNFSDFYSKDRWAVFQAGLLYLDNRSCELCIKVDDPGTHAVIATMSKACIAYVDCKRPGAAMKVAACFTQGDSDYLYVGHNGIFVDRHGKDWDATIVKLIDNPISIRQAFLSPYKKFIRFIEEQIAKRAQSADDASNAAMTGAATDVAGAASGTPPPPPAPKKFDVGTVAALGVAVGGITGALGIVFGAFLNLKGWMPIGFLGVLVAISGPSVLIAWLKLRQRTLGPLLEASGWAINGRVQINMPLGRALTDCAKIPAGAHRSLRDPYRDKGEFWRVFAFWFFLAALAGALIAAAIYHQWPFTPKPEHSQTTSAPDAPPSAPSGAPATK